MSTSCTMDDLVFVLFPSFAVRLMQSLAGSIHFLQQQLNYSRGKSVIRKKRNFWARKEYKSVGKSVSCLLPKAKAFMARTSRGLHGQWVKWESSEQILFLLVCLFVVNGLSSL